MRSTLLSHFLGVRTSSLISHGWQWLKSQQMLALVYSEFDQQSYSSRVFIELPNVLSTCIRSLNDNYKDIDMEKRVR